MGKLIDYRTILHETEDRIKEWDQALLEIEKELGDDADIADALSELDPIEADYYMKLLKKAEQLHRWLDQDRKYGMYRRGAIGFDY